MLSCVPSDNDTGEEFWGAGKTMQALAEGNYFETSDTGGVQWPHALKAMFSERLFSGGGGGGGGGGLTDVTAISAGDVVGFGVATEFELAASALGACVWCLKRAHLEYSLLTLANFRVRLCTALWNFWGYVPACEGTFHN